MYSLQKYDAAGSVLWSKGAGGSGMDYGYSVATDMNGNAFITGWFDSPTITFGNITLTNAGVGAAIFLVKYGPSGNVLWANTASGSTAQNAYGVATDNSGNVYIAGEFQSPTIAFGTTTLTNAGGIVPYDMFIAKCDANGNFLWASSAGGTGTEIANAVAVDAAGNAYVTGNFSSGALTFSNTTLTNLGASDIFVTKYNSNGTVAWATRAGGGSDDGANGITIDNAGNIGLAGMFQSPYITFGNDTLTNAGNYDIFIAALNPAGNALWGKAISGTLSDEVFSISNDNLGNYYISGAFQSSILSVGNSTLTNAGNYDILLAKINSAGVAVWAKNEGGAGYDYGYSVCTFTNTNIYMSGYFSSQNLVLGTTTLSCTGGSDLFITKLAPVSTNINTLTDSNSGYIVYPNPFNNSLKVEQENIGSIIRLELCNGNGQIVQKIEKKELDSKIIDIHFNEFQLADNFYFLKIISQQGVITKKLVHSSR